MDYNDTYTEFLNLYKLSEQPFSPQKSWSTCKEFTNSFGKIEKKFVPDELKQVVPPKGIKPLSPRS